MKKNLIIASAVVFASAFTSASAQLLPSMYGLSRQAIERGTTHSAEALAKAPAANLYDSFTDDGMPLVTVYHETFSKMKGNDANPTVLKGSKSYYDIPNSMLEDTSLEYVSCRSGASFYGDGNIILKGESYLSPYLGDSRGEQGKFKVTLRAKSYNAGTTATLTASCTFDGLYMQSFNYNLTDQYEWIEIYYNSGNAFTMVELENVGDIVIDEIKIERGNSNLTAPTMKAPEDVTSDGFTGIWYYAPDAEGVTVDIFSYAKESTLQPVVSTTETFASVARNANGTLNQDEPNLPEGWSARIEDPDAVLPTLGSGYAMVLTHKWEHITTPNFDEAPYTALSFDAKATAAPAGAKIIVEERINNFYSNRWEKIAEIDAASLSEFTNIDLSSKLSGQGHYIKFSYIGAAGSCAIGNVKYTYGGHRARSKEYLFENIQYPAMKFAASDLDPKTEYYYRVRSYNKWYYSDYSNIIRGRGKWNNNELIAPQPLQPRDVTSKGFMAQWEPTDAGMNYLCQIYRKNLFTENTQFEVLKETFDNIIVDAEMESPNYAEYPAATYGILPGFSTQRLYLANGMAGIRNFRDSKGVSGGWWKSPQYDFGQMVTSYKITFKAYGPVGTKVQVDSYQDNSSENYSRVTKSLTTSDGEILEFEFTGSKTTRFEVRIDNNSNYVLFDEMTISKLMLSGETITVLADEVYTSEAQAYIPTPDYEEGKVLYGYCLYDLYEIPDEYGSKLQKIVGPSPMMSVDQTSSVSEIENSNIKIYSTGSDICVMLPSAQAIEVYTLSGARISSVMGHAGSNVISLDAKGVYIVRTAGKVAKVVL